MNSVFDPKWIITNEPKGIKITLLVTPEQLRAARALLGWSQTGLAGQAGIGVVTVGRRGESERDPKSPTTLVVACGRRLNEGVEFIDENGGGPGVRLRKRQRLKTPK